jgi:hypothetical protein
MDIDPVLEQAMVTPDATETADDEMDFKSLLQFSNPSFKAAFQDALEQIMPVISPT